VSQCSNQCFIDYSVSTFGLVVLSINIYLIISSILSIIKKDNIRSNVLIVLTILLTNIGAILINQLNFSENTMIVLSWLPALLTSLVLVLVMLNSSNKESEKLIKDPEKRGY